MIIFGLTILPAARHPPPASNMEKNEGSLKGYPESLFGQSCMAGLYNYWDARRTC